MAFINLTRDHILDPETLYHGLRCLDSAANCVWMSLDSWRDLLSRGRDFINVHDGRGLGSTVLWSSDGASARIIELRLATSLPWAHFVLESPETKKHWRFWEPQLSQLRWSVVRQDHARSVPYAYASLYEPLNPDPVSVWDILNEDDE